MPINECSVDYSIDQIYINRQWWYTIMSVVYCITNADKKFLRMKWERVS